MHSSNFVLWTFLGSLFILHLAYSQPQTSPDRNGINFDTSCSPFRLNLSNALRYAHRIVVSGLRLASRPTSRKEITTNIYDHYFLESERETVMRVFETILETFERQGPVTVNFICSYTGACAGKAVSTLANFNLTTENSINLCRYKLNFYANMDEDPCGNPFGQIWAIVIINALLHTKQLVYPTQIYDLASDYETVQMLRNGTLDSARPETEREQMKPSANAASYLYMAIHPWLAIKNEARDCNRWAEYLNETFGGHYLGYSEVVKPPPNVKPPPRVPNTPTKYVPIWILDDDD